MSRAIWKEIIGNGVKGNYELKEYGFNSNFSLKKWKILKRNTHEVIEKDLTLNDALVLSKQLIGA